MAIKFISIKCPECGATLDIEEGRRQIFCSYCGTRVMVQNDNEYIYHHIDEAQIKQAEVNQEVQLRRMEIIERKLAAAEKSRKAKVILTIILAIFAVAFIGLGFGGENFGLAMPGLVCCYILMFMWMNNKDKEDDDDLNFGDKVKVPSSISDFENKNYAAIEAMLVSAGFTNIKCVPLNDLIMGVLKKPGTVESITINGRTVVSGGKKFSPNATVVISYHSHG